MFITKSKNYDSGDMEGTTNDQGPWVHLQPWKLRQQKHVPTKYCTE